MRKSSRRQSFASKVLISVKYSFNLGTRGHRMFQDWDCAHYNPSVTFGNDAYISFKGILLAHTHRTGIIYTLCMTMPPCRVDITEFIHSLFRIEYHKYVSLSISFLKMFLNVLIGYRCQSSQHLVCLSIQKNHQLSLLYIHNRGFLDLNIIRHFNWGLYHFFFFLQRLTCDGGSFHQQPTFLYISLVLTLNPGSIILNVPISCLCYRMLA